VAPAAESVTSLFADDVRTDPTRMSSRYSSSRIPVRDATVRAIVKLAGPHPSEINTMIFLGTLDWPTATEAAEPVDASATASSDVRGLHAAIVRARRRMARIAPPDGTLCSTGRTRDSIGCIRGSTCSGTKWTHGQWRPKARPKPGVSGGPRYALWRIGSDYSTILESPERYGPE